MTASDRLLTRLERVRRTGPGRYQARCPAHEDRNPSLAIREAEDGRLLLHCWAGCATEDVLAALGLGWGDLFPERDHRRHQLRRDPEAERRRRIAEGLRRWCATTGRRLRDEFYHRDSIRHYAAERLGRDPEDALALDLYAIAVHAGRPLVELEEALDWIDGAKSDDERADAFALYSKGAQRAA